MDGTQALAMTPKELGYICGTYDGSGGASKTTYLCFGSISSLNNCLDQAAQAPWFPRDNQRNRSGFNVDYWAQNREALFPGRKSDHGLAPLSLRPACVRQRIAPEDQNRSCDEANHAD